MALLCHSPGYYWSGCHASGGIRKHACSNALTVLFGVTVFFNNKQTGGKHMKKTFIISSLMAITIALPAFATPTELDKKTVASKAYVDTKQDIIETGLVEFTSGDMLPAITTYDATSGLVSNKIGILDQVTIEADECVLSGYGDVRFYGAEMDSFVPTVRAVARAIQHLAWDSAEIRALIAYSTLFGDGTNDWPANDAQRLVNGAAVANAFALKQNKIAKSGYYHTMGAILTAYGNDSNTNGWLNAGVKGTGIVTKTATDGVVGERKIFEASDVANYHATGLTQIQKDIQDISIPTVGAVMNIVSTNAPTGTANTLANYDANGALGSGIATANAPTHNATTGVLENGTNIATIAAVDTRQKKKQCAGYETGHENDPAYCWLWDFPED